MAAGGEEMNDSTHVDYAYNCVACGVHTGKRWDLCEECWTDVKTFFAHEDAVRQCIVIDLVNVCSTWLEIEVNIDMSVLDLNPMLLGLVNELE